MKRGPLVLGVALVHSAHGELEVESDVVIMGLAAGDSSVHRSLRRHGVVQLYRVFSPAAIEAMALRKPLVHSDVGGAAEMIVPGRNGFLFWRSVGPVRTRGRRWRVDGPSGHSIDDRLTETQVRFHGS